jgi:site-specific recombinase XerD
VATSFPVLDAFVAHVCRNGLSTCSARAYARDIADFGEFLMERPSACGLIDATPDWAVLYVQSLFEERKLSASSVRRRVASLRRFYSFLQGSEYRRDNPALALAPAYGLYRGGGTLSAGDVAKMRAARVNLGDEWLATRDRATIELLCSSGVRVSELVGLNVEDVDRNGRTLRIRGKGNMVRVVRVRSTAVVALDRWFEVRPRPRLQSGALFISKRGSRLTTRLIQYTLAAVRRAAGIRQPASPHTLRHSFATRLLERCAHPLTNSELLAHKTLDIRDV